MYVFKGKKKKLAKKFWELNGPLLLDSERVHFITVHAWSTARHACGWHRTVPFDGGGRQAA